MNDSESRPVNSFALAEYNWLLRAEQNFRRDPANVVLMRIRDEAAARYWRAVAAESEGRDDSLANSARSNADLLDADDTPANVRDFLIASAILMGAAVLSSAIAGAVGAVVVKEVVLKEIVKGAISGFITTGAALAAERVFPPRRRLRLSTPPTASGTPTNTSDYERSPTISPSPLTGTDPEIEIDGVGKGEFGTFEVDDGDDRSQEIHPDQDDERGRDL